MNALEERVRQLEDDAAALLQIACSAQEVAFALHREWLGRETQAEQQSQNVQDESIYDFIRRRKRYKQDD